MTGIVTIDTEMTSVETETTEETTVVAPTHQTAKTVTDVRFLLLQNLKQLQVPRKLLHQRMRNSRRRGQSLRLGRRIAKLRRRSTRLKSKPWLLLVNLHQVSTFFLDRYFLISHHLIHASLVSAPTATPAKPGTSLNRAALTGLGLKGLPLKPEVLKVSKGAAAMDDSVETKQRKLETLGDMPAVDMTMADGEASVGDLEVDDDDDEANRMDQAIKSKAAVAMDEDEDAVDPLDAFMSSVSEEVKKVDEDDLKKMNGGKGPRE